MIARNAAVITQIRYLQRRKIEKVVILKQNGVSTSKHDGKSSGSFSKFLQLFGCCCKSQLLENVLTKEFIVVAQVRGHCVFRSSVPTKHVVCPQIFDRKRSVIKSANELEIQRHEWAKKAQRNKTSIDFRAHYKT